jgi:hypothetical protein
MVEGSQLQMLPAPNRQTPRLPLATMLRVVVLEPHLRRLLAPFQRRPLERRQIPQPGQIPPPGFAPL